MNAVLDVTADGEPTQQRPEKEVRAELKRAMYTRAPLFVRMRALIRREVLAEIQQTEANRA